MLSKYIKVKIVYRWLNCMLNNIRLNNFPNVLNVLNECNKHNNKYSNTFNVYQNLYTYYQWIATTGDNYSRFNIDTILNLL